MAGAEIFSLFGRIGADNIEAIKAIDDTVSHAKQADGKLSSALGGFGKSLNDGLQTFARGASDTLTSIGKAATSAGNALTNKITKPALAATSAIGALVGGMALTKGWNRLVGIDTARAKLSALGHSAQSVDSIMDNALAAVKGTAFGLEEAATTASTAVAAGIKPGKELERYLSLVGDTAAIAGTNMGEMGSIFNKVATSGVIQAEELNQIGDRGIPILQMLADEMGVTTDEVKKLASEGKVSSDTFLKAIENGFGGAAKIMGEKSFTAALDNIGASISRIGANFLDGAGTGKGFFSQLKPLMAEFSEWLGTIEEKAIVMGEAVGKAFADTIERLKALKQQWDGLGGDKQQGILKMATAITALTVGAGPFLKVFGSVAQVFGGVSGAILSGGNVIGGLITTITAGTASLSTFGTVLGGVFSALGALSSVGMAGAGFGALIAGLGLVQKTFGDEIDKLLDLVTTKGPEIISQFGNSMVNSLPELLTLGSVLITNVMNAITANLPALFDTGMAILTTLTDGLMVNLPMILESAGALLAQLALGLSNALPMLAMSGLQIIMTLITSIGENLPQIMAVAGQILMNLVNGIVMALPTLIPMGLQMLTALANGIISSIPVIISTAGQIISTLLGAILTNLPQLLQGGIQMLFSIINGIISNLPAIVGAIVEVVLSIVATIGENLPMILESGISILLGLISGIVETIPKLLAVVPDIFTRVVDAFKSQDWLSIGSNIIDGIVKGVKNMAGTLIDTATTLASDAWGAIKNFFDMRSPSKLTEKEGGVMIVRGIIEGFQRMKRPLIGAAKELSNWASPKIDKGVLYEFGADYDELTSLAPTFKGFDRNVNHNLQSPVEAFRLGLEENNQLLRNLLMTNEALLNSSQNLESKNDGVYMDSREVSKVIDQPLEEYRRIKETVKNRFMGAY